MKNLIVPQKFNNKKLSVYLSHEFDGLSINTIYKALRKKDIIINGNRVTENVLISTNDNIIIYIKDELLYKKVELDIVYEDDNIVVFNKPIGIETLPTFHDYVKEYYNSTNDFPMPCHRIDRNTSGLLLFAKTQEALDIILDGFKNNKIEKHYICKVYGVPKKKEDTLTAYLFKDNKKSLVYISDIPKKGHQKIVTSYTILKNMTCRGRRPRRPGNLYPRYRITHR